MHYIINYGFNILISFLLLFGNCGRKEVPIEKIKNIYWQHSFEDDAGDTIVYRPKNYDFPPSRGREGFEFKENGIFVKYMIAPQDGIRAVTGYWDETGETNIYIIRFDENSEDKYPVPEGFKMHLLEYQENPAILKIREFLE